MKNEPTFNGETVNKGRIVIGRPYAEGYAVIKCGETEVQISYTLLHYLRLDIDSNSYYAKEMYDLQRALNSITCEASQGKKGD